MATPRLAVFVLVALCCLAVHADEARDGRLFLKQHATTTALTVSYSTTTVPYTCATAVDLTTACSKKRRKRSLIIEQNDDISAIDASFGALDSDDASDLRNARGLYTFWSTVLTTIVDTSTVIDTGTTASVKIVCVISDNELVPMCG